LAAYVGVDKLFADPFAINYQFGYLIELQQTIADWGKTNEFARKKYPLIWLRQPVTITRDSSGYYGKVENLSLFIIVSTDPRLKATERMETVFKPIIYPIYRKVLQAIDLLSDKIQMEYFRPHTITDRYYWGDAQKQEVGDAVDCLEISQLKFIIENNQNC
jgi:hypothetical protein